MFGAIYFGETYLGNPGAVGAFAPFIIVDSARSTDLVALAQILKIIDTAGSTDQVLLVAPAPIPGYYPSIATTTDQILLNELQYAATETPNQGASWPSGLWTVDELAGYLTERQRRFLYETGAICILSGPILTIPNLQRYALPADWIQSRRVTWMDPSGTIAPLLRSAIWYLDYGLVSWETVMSPKPLVFLDDVLPTLEIQIAPAASDEGVLQLLYVGQGPALSNTGVPLIIPDDCLPILKWGVLADLFGKVGRAHDPERAAYAEGRFLSGIEIVKGLLWGWADQTPNEAA